MTTSGTPYVISAKEAAGYANVTYRQVDHWARKGWVSPSLHSGAGRGTRRLYSVDDVLRMAALRHFAMSGWTVGGLGEVLADAELGDAAWVAVGSKSGFHVLSSDRGVLELLSAEEKLSAYQLGPLRKFIALGEAPAPRSPGVSIVKEVG